MKALIPFAAAALASMASTNAAIINLDSTDSNNGVTLSLGPGEYTATFLEDAFTAWNPWGRTKNCNGDGESCSKGWVTGMRLSSEELGIVSFGWNGRFSTADAALAAADVYTFTLSRAQQVVFYIGDSQYRDNVGGLAVQIEAQATPIPPGVALFGTAAAALAIGRRRLNRSSLSVG
ncbi:MAG: hypothetical protein AAF830_15915 [Pseudomonadota bacterium]